MSPDILSIIILGLAILFYVTEWLPIPIVAMSSSALMVLFGVINASDAWAAFAQDTVLLMAGIVIIGSCLFSTGAAGSIADFLIKVSGHRTKLSICLMLILAGTMSSVMNNTTCTVMFLPLILGVIAKSNEEGIYEQKYMQMLTVVTSVGGLLTLVGSGVNVTASGILEASGYAPFTMTQFTKISLPMFLVTLLYVTLIGDKFADKLFGKNPDHCEFVNDFFKQVAEKNEDDKKHHSEKELKEAKRKKLTSAVILVITVIGLLTKNIHGISLGTVGVCGGLLCVITGCMTVKEMYNKIDWGTILLLGGTIGCAAGLSKSGGGQLIADFFVGIFGYAMTPVTVFVVMTVLSSIMTQFMSNTATVSVLLPIGVSIASGIGMNPIPVAIGITMAASCSFATPMASPTQAMVINWGSYKFIDYVKYSGPITVLLNILILVLTPIFYPLV